MGQVTSVYADQIIGKISYSQQIVTDLAKRDFSVSNLFPKSKGKNYLTQITQSIQSIYGFTQSYCQGFIFTTIYQHNQYLVYNNGRFVIKINKHHLPLLKQGIKQNMMIVLPHEDVITAMDVNDNLCAVGTLGGRLVVWDMKFDQIKVDIILPKPSISFSSISLTKKYIFVTDTSMPNNIAYCFDFQTTKLKSFVLINSLQPTLRGIRFKQNYHVTVCADGLWFIRYSASQNQLQVTKGMFTQFPKTSQCSIANINDKHIITGGVDGYVYIWNSHYECIKVIRAFDQQQEISAIAYSKDYKMFIVGSILSKIKCFTFDIKEKFKDKTQTQKYQDIQYSLAQAYDDQFPTQNIVVSKQNKLLYFKTNHSGKLMSHLLPSNQPFDPQSKSFNNVQFIRFSRKGDSIIKAQSDQIVSVKNIYPKNQSTFNYDLLYMTKSKDWWSVQEKLQISIKPINPKYLTLYTFCPYYQCLAYIHENTVTISFLNRINNGDNNQQVQLKESNFSIIQKDLQVYEVEVGIIVVGINFLEVLIKDQLKIYLFITLQEKCLVFQVKNKREYVLETTVTFLKEQFNNFKIEVNPQTKLNVQKVQKEIINDISQHITNENKSQFQVKFNNQLSIWQQYQTDSLSIQKMIINVSFGKEIQSKENSQNHQKKKLQKKQNLSNIHTAVLKQFKHTKNKQITIGGSSLIIWKTTN